MNTKEDINGFYQRINYSAIGKVSQDGPHINVFERADCKTVIPYSRRDYYKVTLLIGKGKLEYANRTIYIDTPVLLFTNPLVPYYWQPESEDQEGWFCIFNDAFVKQRDELLSDLPMFDVDTEKVYYPDKQSVDRISDLYRKMMEENKNSYPFKQDLMRNYLHLIIYEALKMNPVKGYELQKNASARVTSLFIELLGRQFPIDSVQNQLKLKSAKDFSHHLSVHTNHLNKAVKEITGKTTTEYITARIILEANDLLKHTNWPISEIGYCLGFDSPAYFTTFYKKYTGRTPNEMRKTID